MLKERLAMRHKHRHKPDGVGIADDFDELILPTRAPVGIDHIAARDLQTAARSLKAPIRGDLLLHLHERR